jgi:hypothetical protein
MSSVVAGTYSSARMSMGASTVKWRRAAGWSLVSAMNW